MLLQMAFFFFFMTEQHSIVFIPHLLYQSDVCFVLLLLVATSCLTLFVTPWAVDHQVPLSMGFSRQEYWSGLPSPSPGDLPHTRIELTSPALADRFFTTESPRKPFRYLDLSPNQRWIQPDKGDEYTVHAVLEASQLLSACWRTSGIQKTSTVHSFPVLLLEFTCCMSFAII